jgi:hypothetical protein
MKARTFVRRFVLLLPVLAVLIVALSILLIRYDNPEISEIRHHDLGYNTLAHHRFTRSGCDNDIVLVGDSTLLMGVMPQVVGERLHESVINLGLFATSGLDTYTLMLDNYLKCNKRPNCVVFCFAASTPFYFNEHSYEKTYTQLKYGSVAGTLLHPKDVDITDCVRAASTIVSGIWANAKHLARARKLYSTDLAYLDATNGFFRNSATAPLSEGEKFSTKLRDDLDVSFIERLKKRYEGQGIKVLYFVSPLPAGDGGIDYFRKQYRNIDNAITVLPNSSFADSRHMTEKAAMNYSKQFAEFLKARIHRDAKEGREPSL